MLPCSRQSKSLQMTVCQAQKLNKALYFIMIATKLAHSVDLKNSDSAGIPYIGPSIVNLNSLQPRFN